VNELQSAARSRYGVSLTYADAAALFNTSGCTEDTIAGQAVTVHGCTDIDVAGKTVTVDLDSLTNGSFVLASKSRELALAR
jgi:hypothetical protein